MLLAWDYDGWLQIVPSFVNGRDRLTCSKTFYTVPYSAPHDCMAKIRSLHVRTPFTVQHGNMRFFAISSGQLEVDFTGD